MLTKVSTKSLVCEGDCLAWKVPYPSLMYLCFGSPKVLSSFGAIFFFLLFHGGLTFSNTELLLTQAALDWGFLSLDTLPGRFNTERIPKFMSIIKFLKWKAEKILLFLGELLPPRAGVRL